MTKLASALTAWAIGSAETGARDCSKPRLSRQGNRKSLEGGHHVDRDAQFESINATVEAFQAAGQPVVSVDTKKKELVGNFKNGAATIGSKGDPLRVKVHDFEDKDLGKVMPYGVYDVTANEGWVSVGITADTAEFAEVMREPDGNRGYPRRSTVQAFSVRSSRPRPNSR